MNDELTGFVSRVVAVALLIVWGDAPATRQGLQPGASITRAIAASDAHRFEIAVRTGDFVKVTADQQNADVRLDLQFPGAAPVTVNDPEKRRFGRELLLWVAPGVGTAELTVAAASAGDAGRYTLTLSISPGGDAARDAIALLDAARRAQPPEGEARDAGPGVPPFQLALEAWRAIGDREVIAACLFGLGAAQHRTLGRPADAVTSLNEALALYKDLELQGEMARTYQQIGHAQRLLSRADLSTAAYEAAYELSAYLDPINRAVIEDDIGQAALDTGDLERAVDFGRRASDAFRAAGARRDEFVSLQRLAIAYQRSRQFDDATRTIATALELGRQYGRSTDLVSLTLAAGRIAAAVGDDETALAHFNDTVQRASDNTFLRLTALLSIGRVYNARRDWRSARDVLERALSEVPPQLVDMGAAVSNELGISLGELGDLPRALQLQTNALAVVQRGTRTGEIAVRRGLAATYRKMGDRANADAMTSRAADIIEALPGQPAQAAILHDYALNAAAGGDLLTARDRLDGALAILDSERGRLQSQSLRTSFGTTAAEYYEDAIDVEMALHAKEPSAGHDARAFELFERSRARSLADLLSEARIDARAGVDPARLAEQRALQKQLADRDTTLRDLAGRPAARERADALVREISDLERRLAVIDGRIRASNPHYAALVRPAPPSLADTQRLLDDDTVLLAFALGEKRSWGWAVTRQTIRSFALPPSADVDERARQVYANVTARRGADAAALSDAIFGPIGTALAADWKTKRLAIVATGALEYVPFDALPLPSPHGRRLIADDHEVVRITSFATLALLRSEAERRRQPSTTIAVIADPVFSADDPRVASKDAAAGDKSDAGARALLRGTEGAARTGFGRLVFSRDEANAIASFSPRVLEALDFQASLTTLTGPTVARAKILHIATHGILNTAHPELSGVVLSLVDRSGRRQDGIVHLYDILGLSLSADLVVLSGCQTGLGREIKGEGLVGLTRAFMHAGAPRVMASLWEVDDRATAELMRRFYRGMLVRNERPAAALRSAQRQMRADPRWTSPYYWAGFTLVGDWR